MSTTSRWSVLVPFMLVTAGTQVAWVVFAPVTTVAAAHYGVSPGAVGWAAQIFPLLYVVLAIPAGLLLDRSFRVSLAAGALLAATGTTLRHAGGFGWVLAGQTVVAIAQPLVLNAITGVTSRYLAPRQRPLGIALGTAANFAGMVVAFGLGAVFSHDDQLDTLVAVGTVLSVASGIWLALALRTPGSYDPGRGAPGVAAVRAVFRHRFMPPVLVLVAAGFGVAVTLMTWLQALLEPAGVSASVSGTLLLVLVLAGVAGCAVIPPAIARRGRQPQYLALCLVAAAVGAVVLALVPGVVTGAIVCGLLGLLLLASLPVVLELVERLVGDEAGTASGLVWMSGNVGGFAVALAVQGLLHHPSLAFLLIALVPVMCAPALAPLSRRLLVRAAA